MLDEKKQTALTFEERCALAELAGEFSIPGWALDNPLGRMKIEEAFDNANVPRYREELEPESYEAILLWLEERPDPDSIDELVCYNEDDDDDGEGYLPSLPAPTERPN